MLRVLVSHDTLSVMLPAVQVIVELLLNVFVHIPMLRLLPPNIDAV